MFTIKHVNKRKRQQQQREKNNYMPYFASSLVNINERVIEPIVVDITKMPSISELKNNNTTLNHKSEIMSDKCSTFELLKMKPLLPMLAKPIEPNRIQFNEYIYEEKYDGERMLAVLYSDNEQHFYTRTLTRSNAFKYRIKLADNVHNCIVDGELIYLNVDNKIIPICDTGIRSALKIQYRIFDIQWYNGKNVTSKPLLERKRLLEQTIISDPNVCLSEYANCIDLSLTMSEFDRIVNSGGEGLVLKQLDSSYISNCRQWIKLKKLHIKDRKEEYELYAHRLKNDKNGVPNILDCGYYDCDGIYVHVCNVASGIDVDKRLKLKLLSDPNSGFLNQRVIVTLHADKITANKSLRHPSLYRIRTDIDVININLFK